MAHPMKPSPTDDARFLSALRPRRFHDAEELAGDGEGDQNEALLLVDGTALLSATTPFGPHDAVLLHSPALLNLPRALAGTRDVSVTRIAEGSETIPFTAEDARALAFSTGPDGPPFRRLALSSLASALRGTNDSLSRFFEGGEPPSPPRVRVAPPATPALPADGAADEGAVDGRAAHDLFDAAGLDPSVLPALGLTARTLRGGARLVSAGERGDEAYLVAEGRLLVSLLIPGAGHEALGFAGRGEIVGEMALVDDAPRSADVSAHGGPALVYVLSRGVFRSLLESGDPAGAPLLGGTCAALCRRLEEALRKAAGFRILAGPG